MKNKIVVGSILEKRQKLLIQELAKYVLLLCIVLPLLIFLRILTYPAVEIHDSWKDYTVVVVGSGVEAQGGLLQAAPALKELFEREDVMHADAQRVHLFTYQGMQNGVKSLRLNEIQGSFENRDPRLDPYVKKLGAYFEGRLDGAPAEVFYIPQASSSVLEELEKNLKSSRIEYYLSDREREGQTALWILYLLNLALLTAFLPGGGRMIFAIGGLVPLIGIGQFSFSLFVPAVTQLIGWAVLSGWIGTALKKHLNIGYPRMRRDLMRYVTVYLLFSVSGAAVTAHFEDFGEPLLLWAALLFGIALHGLFLFLYADLMGHRVHRQEHVLFFPVSLRWEKQCERGVLVKGMVLLGTLVLIPVTFAILPFEAGDLKLEYPQPESGTVGTGFSREEMTSFSQHFTRNDTEGDGTYLPDIADYISHRAYQDGFLYGRDYGFPSPDEKIVLPVFKKEGTRVFRSEKVFKMFTEKWYKDILADASQNGITRILLAQDGPVKVSCGVGEFFPVTFYTVIGYVGIVVLMFPLTIIVISKRLEYKRSFREKQQQKKGQKVA